jgi:hypothetical protein
MAWGFHFFRLLITDYRRVARATRQSWLLVALRMRANIQEVMR